MASSEVSKEMPKMTAAGYLTQRMRSLTFEGKAKVVLAFFCIPLLLFTSITVTNFTREQQTLKEEAKGNKDLLPLLLQQLKASGLPHGDSSAVQTAMRPDLESVASLERSAYLIGDESGMILDTELHTLYLSLITAQVLPKLITAGSELRSIQLGITEQQGFSFWKSSVVGQLDVLERFTGIVNQSISFSELKIDDLVMVRSELKQLSNANDLKSQSGLEVLTRFHQFIEERIQLNSSVLEIALAKRQRELLSSHVMLALVAALSLFASALCFWIFYRGTVLDIEEQKRIDAELRYAKAKAERLSRLKSEFMSNMSHEIRTPLNGVFGMLELAQTAPNPQELYQYLGTAKKSTKALFKVLNEVLDYSKLEANSVTLESRTWDLFAVIDDLRSHYLRLCTKKNLEFQAQIHPKVPRLICGDALRTRQVLNNLLDNAVKFTERGSVSLGVRIGYDAKEQEVLVFEVKDTGIGIEPEKETSVFEAFEQADLSSTRKYGGTGLGLTISAELVKLMKGTLSVTSSLGSGSVFRFELPLEQRDQVASEMMSIEDAPQDLENQHEDFGTRSFSKSLQILLVEDNKINQKLAKVLLTNWGHQVAVAENGQEAVEAFKTQHWDLVLMDLQMPIMDGYDATRLIRKSESPGERTPIVAISARTSREEIYQCLQAGMDDHLAKPYSSTQLAEIIAKNKQVA